MMGGRLLGMKGRKQETTRLGFQPVTPAKPLPKREPGTVLVDDVMAELEQTQAALATEAAERHAAEVAVTEVWTALRDTLAFVRAVEPTLVAAQIGLTDDVAEALVTFAKHAGYAPAEPETTDA